VVYGRRAGRLYRPPSSLMLDPIDTEVLLVEDRSDGRWWLEFHLPPGVMAAVEIVD